MCRGKKRSDFSGKVPPRKSMILLDRPLLYSKLDRHKTRAVTNHSQKTMQGLISSDSLVPAQSTSVIGATGGTSDGTSDLVHISAY